MSNAWRLFLEISILIFVTWFLLNSTVTLNLSSNRINGNCVEQHFQNHLFLSILEHQQMMFSESEVVVFRWIRVRNGTINYSFSFSFPFYVSVVHISILCVSGKSNERDLMQRHNFTVSGFHWWGSRSAVGLLKMHERLSSRLNFSQNKTKRLRDLFTCSFVSAEILEAFRRLSCIITKPLLLCFRV